MKNLSKIIALVALVSLFTLESCKKQVVTPSNAKLASTGTGASVNTYKSVVIKPYVKMDCIANTNTVSGNLTIKLNGVDMGDYTYDSSTGTMSLISCNVGDLKTGDVVTFTFDKGVIGMGNLGVYDTINEPNSNIIVTTNSAVFTKDGVARHPMKFTEFADTTAACSTTAYPVTYSVKIY